MIRRAKIKESPILKNTSLPSPPGEITADFIWGKKYEKGKRKRGTM
jgi:hypothetical protein